MSTTPIKNDASNYTLSNSTQAKERLDKNTLDFLNLLMTELKYQDPYEPMDAKEMSAQLIQMNGVEQSIKTNKHLEALLDLHKAEAMDHQIAYLGKRVTSLQATSDSAIMLEGGKANLRFELPQATDKVFVTIRDQNNREVYQAQIGGVAGFNTFAWDANLAENPLKDGVYKINITALDDNDLHMAVKMLKSGVVQSTVVENGQLILDDNTRITADNIVEVGLAQ